MSEKSEENSVMGRTLNWQSEISVIAGPRQAGDTRESWLARAARKSGASFWHIKALFYGQLTDPKFSIASKIISAADKARLEETRRNEVKATEIYRIHAARLEAIDPDFHREQIDVLLSAARIIGERNST